MPVTFHKRKPKSKPHCFAMVNAVEVDQGFSHTKIQVEMTVVVSGTGVEMAEQMAEAYKVLTLGGMVNVSEP